LSHQQACAANDGQNPNDGKSDNPTVERSFREVISETYYTCPDEQTTEDRDGYWALHSLGTFVMAFMAQAYPARTESFNQGPDYWKRGL